MAVAAGAASSAPDTSAPSPAAEAAVRNVADSALSPPAETTEEYADGIRVVSASEFNELDAAADEVAAADDVKVVPADEINEIDLAAGPPVTTDGRNPDSVAPPPTERSAKELVTLSWILAFGLGGPLLIGLLAWPLMARRRPAPSRHYRWSA